MGLEHHAVGMAKTSTSCAAMAKNAILQLEERSPRNGSGTPVCSRHWENSVQSTAKEQKQRVGRCWAPPVQDRADRDCP